MLFALTTPMIQASNQSKKMIEYEEELLSNEKGYDLMNAADEIKKGFDEFEFTNSF